MDLVEGLKPAIVAITADNDGKEVIGTGFFVTSDGYILTCYHVVGDILGRDKTVKIKTSTGTMRDAFFVESKSQKDPDIDFAVLKVNGLEDCPYLRLSTDFTIHDRWCTVGFIYPKTLEHVPDDGKIYSLVPRRNQKGQAIELTARNEINPGASGSPVLIDKTGSVIGIIKSVAGKVQLFAVPIKDVFDRWPELSTVNSEKSPTLLDVRDIVSEFLLDSSGDRPGIPHEISGPPEDFKGRAMEIQEIASNFGRGVVICGMGGAGKTAMAYKLADILRYRFPDGQVMVDMRGTSPEQLSKGDAMGQIIRAFDPAVSLPEDENRIKGQYNSILSEKRALILLDNVFDDRQVMSILPPRSCGLIITSRKRFRLPGLNFKDLDPLQPSDARDLILAINEQIDDYADDLAKLCGYLPLALRASASLLANRIDVIPVDYIKELKEERSRLECIGNEGVEKSVEASFNLSFARLSDAQASAFCIASIFPADFDAPAEEIICLDAGHKSLSALVQWNLIDYTSSTKFGKGGRYHLHDLARLYANSRLNPGDGSAARQRHAEFYQSVCSKATELIMQGGNDMLTGLNLFDAEWSNIKVGQTWAEQNAKNGDRAAALCIAYADAHYILSLRLHPREQIQWMESSLVASRETKDRMAESKALDNLGYAYQSLCDFPKAIECYEQALAIDREMGNLAGEGTTLGNLGFVYSSLGDYSKAIEFLEQSLAISREMGSRASEGNSLGNLGLVYSSLGDYSKAIECYEQSLVIAQETGDRMVEGNALCNLGNRYGPLGDYPKAIEFQEMSLAIAREIGDQTDIGNNLGNLGNAYRSLGDYTKATEYYEQSLAIAREIGNRMSEGNSLGNLGLVCSSLGDYPKAIEFQEKALTIAREIGDRQNEGTALGNLGAAYSSLGDYSKAIEYYEKSLAITREIGNRMSQGNSLSNVGNAYRSLGDYTKAIEYYEQALTIDREIGDRSGERSDLDNLGTAHYFQGDQSKAMEYYEQALTIAREIGDRQNEGNALGNLGVAYFFLGDYSKAIEHYEQALAIAREIGDRQNEGTWMGNLGLVYSSLGDYHKAIKHYEQALAIARETGDRQNEGTALGNLGVEYSSLCDYRKAIEYYEQALTIAREIGNLISEGMWLSNLGAAYSSLGNYRKVIEYYEQALAIAMEIGDEEGQGNALWEISIYHKEKGNLKEAIVQAERALKIFEKIKSSRAQTMRDLLANWKTKG